MKPINAYKGKWIGYSVVDSRVGDYNCIKIIVCKLQGLDMDEIHAIENNND